MNGAEQPVSLTQLEREIVTLLAGGHSVEEIARTLSKAPRTVKRDIAACRQKLNARNNAQLVAIAVSSGGLLISGQP